MGYCYACRVWLLVSFHRRFRWTFFCSVSGFTSFAIVWVLPFIGGGNSPAPTRKWYLVFVAGRGMTLLVATKSLHWSATSRYQLQGRGNNHPRPCKWGKAVRGDAIRQREQATITPIQAPPFQWPITHATVSLLHNQSLLLCALISISLVLFQARQRAVTARSYRCTRCS